MPLSVIQKIESIIVGNYHFNVQSDDTVISLFKR